MKNTKFFLLIFFLSSWLQLSFGQSAIKSDSISKGYHASISGYVGSALILYSAGVNAQVKIGGNKSYKNNSGVWLNAGVGGYIGFGSARYVSLKFDVLNGKKNDDLELSLGILAGGFDSTQSGIKH